MALYRSRATIEAISFSEFVKHGIRCPGASVNNGVPWAFKYHGWPVTHENDSCYLVQTDKETVEHFRPGEMLVVGLMGNLLIVNESEFRQKYDYFAERDFDHMAENCN